MTIQNASARNYGRVATAISRSGTREDRMQRVVDALWEELGGKRVSWLGFYLTNASGEDMILGPRRDKPACSPIGMHGACGRAFNSQRALVVTDVAKLGEGYVACDPRDRSEVVIPMLEPDGATCWGVFDADSFDTDAFAEDDVNGLYLVFLAAALSPDPAGRKATEVV